MKTMFFSFFGSRKQNVIKNQSITWGVEVANLKLLQDRQLDAES
jgi:hypothetical protein